MSDKAYYMLGITLGGAAGGWLPSAFGAGMFSFWGILGSFVGGVAGIWLVYRFLVNP